METRPGHIGTIPVAQIQTHQVRHTSGLPNTQPVPGQPVFAPQSGRTVPVPAGPRPATATPPRLPQTGIVPATPRAEVTVILYSSGQSAQLLSQQLQAIRHQSVQPAAIHVHVDGAHGHDEQSLMKMTTTCRTPMGVGRHFRLALAREVDTPYVLLLEEDTLPGSRWIERALEAIKHGDSEDLAFGPAIVACSGVMLGSSDPGSAHPVGPELPRNAEPMVVDVGRGGWMFATEFARIAEGVPRVGYSTGSLGVLLAVAAQQAGLPTVVMDYGMVTVDGRAHTDHWGALSIQQHGVDPQDAAEAFQSYLEMGWTPEFTGKDLPPPVSQHVEQAPPMQLPQSTPRQPKVTHMGGFTTIERVLEPHERTPDPNTNERLIPPTAPPASARTEHLVAPSPPPESAKTERLVASERPKSQTGI